MEGKQIVSESFEERDNVTTFEECKKACDNDNKCFFANFAQFTRICFLKNEIIEVVDSFGESAYVKGCSKLRMSLKLRPFFPKSLVAQS